MTDIAIVGLGCRFPGAPDVQAYWKLLLGAERQFDTVPGDRWNHDTFHEPDNRRAAAAAYTDQVAFLDDVDRFDALHYGLPPRQVEAMDPQHRLVIDVTREALDDAGLGRGGFDRENTGVFVGISISDYKELMVARVRAIALADGSLGGEADPDAVRAAKEQAERFRPVQAFTLPGSLLNMAPAAVSRQFDLGGPSFAVDAACAGSLVALEQAVTHLRQGTCSTAIVGGVYLSLTPDTLVGFSKVGALSAAGVCRPFDERADGFVLGEGAGSVVIRSLADALADGDRIYAVIRGIGSANNGTTNSPLAPTAEGELRAMRRAYDDAGVAPSSVGFIEAHGTGTSIGDRVEAEALRRLRTEYPDGDPGPCYLSAGKALIGHTMSAAGIAGLIKTALVVHHRTIVPQPDTSPRPELGIEAAGLRFAETARPWPSGEAVRRAAVSSFGFGGTNVHVVLEEPPAPAPVLVRQPRRTEPHLALVSAGSPELLDRHIGALLDTLEHAPTTPMAALAHTLGSRAPLTARLAIVAADTDEFTERLRRARRQLAAGARGDLGDGAFAADAPLPPGRRRTAFVFPGQGSQRPGLMHDLYQRFPDFREAVDTLSATARQHTDLDLTELLYGHGATTRPDDEELRARLAGTDVCQPLLGTVGIAATRLLAACGVTPDLALGHSVGEFTAATAAGALSAEDTIRLLVRRGAAFRQAETADGGGMVAVQTDEQTCQRLVHDIDDVWLACYNHPNNVVVSGSARGLAAVRSDCAQAGVATVALEVSNAFHSPLLAAAEEAIRDDLARLRITGPVLPLVSCVSADLCVDPVRLRELWSRHASAPVRFGDAVRCAYDQGVRVFLQVTGGSSLLASVRRNLADHDDVHVVPAAGPSSDRGRGFLQALAHLAVLGVPVDPRALIAREDRRLLDLPVARLDARPHWIPRGRAVQSGTRPAGVPPQAAAHHTTPKDENAMHELLDLIREQTTVLTRLADALPVQDTAPSKTPTAAIPGVTEITETVFGHVSRISAFPVSHLTADQLLTDDLGFDSLMLTELFTSLSRCWPRLTVDEKLLEPLTVGGIVTIIADGLADAEPPEQQTVIEAFPEVVAHNQRITMLSRLQVPNPYLRVHEGGASDTTVIDGEELLSFSSYNYLGMSGHARVNQAAVSAVEQYGTSVSASRLLSGSRPLHVELEAELAGTLGTQDAITLVSGHATNVTVIGHLVGPGDLIVHDALAHDSIMQGCKLSGATRRPFPHNDAGALDAILTKVRHQYRRVLVVIEGVYSMDGDIADLPALIEVKRRHGALLMIDEAHSLGVIGATGRGIGEYFDVDRSAVELWSGTLSKALASCGGYVAADRAVVEYLRYTLPGFVFSAGMTPANAAASLTALQVLRAEPQRVARLRANAALFVRLAREAGIDTGDSHDTPIVPCIVGESSKTLQLADALFRRGISVNPILHPAVAEHLTRLRFFITCDHTPGQIRHTVAVLEQELHRLHHATADRRPLAA